MEMGDGEGTISLSSSDLRDDDGRMSVRVDCVWQV